MILSFAHLDDLSYKLIISPKINALEWLLVHIADLKYFEFDDFVKCYCADDFSKRKQTWSEENPDGRWRKYSYDEILEAPVELSNMEIEEMINSIGGLV